MKKWWVPLIIASALSLGACGEESKEEPDEKIQTVDETKQDEQKPDSTESNDEEETPIPLAEDEPIELEEGIAQPLKYFGTEETHEAALNGEGDTDGGINFDFEGFKLSSLFFLADFKPNEMYSYEYDEKESVRALIILQQAENTTDREVDYNGTMTIVTDTKEQVNPDFGIMSPNQAVMTYLGKVKSSGYFIVPLKDGSDPNEITVHLEAPHEVVDGAVDPIEGKMGEDQKFTLKGFTE